MDQRRDEFTGKTSRTGQEKLQNLPGALEIQPIFHENPAGSEREETDLMGFALHPLRSPGLRLKETVSLPQGNGEKREGKAIRRRLVGIMLDSLQIALIEISIFLVAFMNKPVVQRIKDRIEDIPAHHSAHVETILVNAFCSQNNFRPHHLGEQACGIEGNSLSIAQSALREGNGLVIVSQFPRKLLSHGGGYKGVRGFMDHESGYHPPCELQRRSKGDSIIGKTSGRKKGDREQKNENDEPVSFGRPKWGEMDFGEKSPGWHTTLLATGMPTEGWQDKSLMLLFNLENNRNRTGRVRQYIRKKIPG
jgi:hypothetical protein